MLIVNPEVIDLQKAGARELLLQLAKKDFRKLISMLFKDAQGLPFLCTSYQLRLLKRVLSRKQKKIFFRACTRAGKSEIISIAIDLFGAIYPNEEIWVISSSTSQSEIIFDRAKKHMFDNELMASMINRKEEFSGQMFSLTNGTSIQCKSAKAGSQKKGEEGEGLLGEGGTLVVLDETGSIPDNIYYNKILRMIATGRRQRFLLESGTPHRLNHIKETSENPEYEVIHVDCYQAAAEGQMDLEEIESARKRLSSIEFDMMYLAKFPDETEDSLIKSAWIANAVMRPEDFPVWDAEDEPHIRRITAGDIARFGTDKTVIGLREFDKRNNMKYLRKIDEYTQQDTMTTVNKLVMHRRNHRTAHIYPDTGGLGAGVHDRLKELNEPVTDVNFGSAARRDKVRFLNLKAELFAMLAKEFENGTIKIPNDRELIDQLRSIRFEIRSDKKMIIIDGKKEGGKSPDKADMLAITMMDDLGQAKVIVRTG